MAGTGSPSVWPGYGPRLSSAHCVSRGRRAVPQEGSAPLGLVLLTDRSGGPAERVQAAQPAAVGLVLPRHRSVALPPGAAQQVQAAVVADAGIRVRLDDGAAGERL